jgi:hypothetical protein
MSEFQNAVFVDLGSASASDVNRLLSDNNPCCGGLPALKRQGIAYPTAIVN